ncbi:MAG TPA: sugar ABC transporter substrate-binding protein [Actinomycetes bacterium]|nr:sugar ABC transporter substrate-binding protein [Actinomycetes bacterium]
MGSTMRRVARLAAVGAVALLAAACATSNGGGGGGGGGGGQKIALLLPESKTTRYEQQDKPNFERKVKELCSACTVLYSNADQDPAKQQQQAEAALTNGAKAMVLDAVDVQSASAIVARAKQSNVPVISYGRLVANADLDYYVSIDPYKVGQQQGTALLDALHKEGKQSPSVVMINGSPTDSNAGPYKKGAHSVLDGAGVKVAKEYDTPDWSPDKAQQEMEQAITAVGQNGFDGVYVANDGMASGAIAAMKGARIEPSSRPVTGQDAELAGIQRILTGEQLMTVYQPIKKIAETSAELAVALATGKTPPAIAKDKVNNGRKQVPAVLLDTIVVTKDNIKDTVVADGFLTGKQICAGKYLQACQAAGIPTS